MKMSSEFNYIVRMHSTNVDGTKLIPYALCEVKGIGVRLSRAIVSSMGLDPDERLGSLSDSEIKRLSDVLEDPSSSGIPEWMFNRQRDPNTGEDLHLIGSDVDLTVREDIERMKETNSWKGRRHSLGLKVRGQRTKTTARKGRSVGVSRKRVRERTQRG